MEVFGCIIIVMEDNRIFMLSATHYDNDRDRVSGYMNALIEIEGLAYQRLEEGKIVATRQFFTGYCEDSGQVEKIMGHFDVDSTFAPCAMTLCKYSGNIRTFDAPDVIVGRMATNNRSSCKGSYGKVSINNKFVYAASSNVKIEEFENQEEINQAQISFNNLRLKFGNAVAPVQQCIYDYQQKKYKSFRKSKIIPNEFLLGENDCYRQL